MTPTETYSCTGTAAALGALLLVCGPATAQGAPAGREITNVATVTYVVSGRPGSADSNTASDRVHELLGVAAAARLQTPVVASDGETARPLAFVLTNAGNGPEAYRLTLEIPATTGAFVPACPRLAIDSNGDGAFDASDAFYGDDAEPVLAPGASVTVFALCDVPQAVNDGQRATATRAASPS